MSNIPTPPPSLTEPAVNHADEIARLRQLLAEATPTPWRWAGNTDTGDVRLDGVGVEGAVFDVDGVERTADDISTRRYEHYLRDERGEIPDGKGGWRPMTEEEIADDVRANWLEDPWGQPRTDNRLHFYEPGFAYRPARDVAVFAVARSQGLPDDTPRSDKRIYRADVVDVRNPNARLIRDGINALPALLDALDKAEAETRRLRARVAELEANGRGNEEDPPRRIGELEGALLEVKSRLTGSEDYRSLPAVREQVQLAVDVIDEVTA